LGHEGLGSGHEGLDRLWSRLAWIGRDPSSGGYRRFAWTPEDAALREWFASECGVRNLDLTEDRMGNQWAWWGQPDDCPGVVTGSHLDSVPDGGPFDGPLGVITAFAAIDRLRADGFRPVRPIGVVNFGDEEGARFGLACAGSKVITGALPAERALTRADADGVSMAEAYRRSGRDPDSVGPDPETLGRVGSFVELHIEQGRGLAEHSRPLGIGTKIWPHGRWRVDFRGEANHAGTTAIADRHDALTALAEAVLAARRSALARGSLATVGKTVIQPGAVNAIPSAATAWLDVRAAEEAAVRGTVADVAAAAEPSRVTVVEESWTPVTGFDPDLVARLGAVLDQPPLMGTGAGHDAGVLANAGIPAAMIFVRNPSGVSHSPAEHAERADCLAGVDALAAVLAELAGTVP